MESVRKFPYVTSVKQTPCSVQGILNLFHNLCLGFQVCLGFASYMWAARDLDANQLV